MSDYNEIKSLIYTEKTNPMMEDGIYCFKVAKSLTKDEIKKLISNTYSVDVIRVNTASYDGKVKKFKGRLGSRSGFKKAFVKVKKDQKINFQD
jgi:large subunit ribosomal protein L23|tara:strand:- start:23314 stop:23592 length:279 start_codon:yes stop_codon:yes gene_type:complete